ncbi:retrotransposon protein, putative, ty3-gypsy subclass [Tanacetum coccineum]
MISPLREREQRHSKDGNFELVASPLGCKVRNCHHRYIHIYSKDERRHEEPRKANLGMLRSERCMANLSKCEFWIPKKGINVRPGGKRKRTLFINKAKLCSAPILALLEGKAKTLWSICDASHQGFRCCASAEREGGGEVPYASRHLKVHDKSYTTHDLELGTECLP